jgi:hypothetical protein
MNAQYLNTSPHCSIVYQATNDIRFN